MVESQEKPQFLIAEALQHILEDGVVSQVAKFLDADKVMQIRVTTAQQCANMNDHKDIALVIDMRSQAAFQACSLDKSINFPPELFTEQRFINWTKEVAAIEKDTSICRTAAQSKNLNSRRRKWIFIILAEKHENVRQTLMRVHTLANKAALTELVGGLKTEQEQLDFLTLRNGVLLFNALKNERCREMDIVLHGFDHIVQNYAFHCIDSLGKPLLPRP